MGSWFENMHIRRSGEVTVDAVAQVLGRMLGQRGYEAADCAEEADSVLALLAGADSEWITVCSDLLPLEDPEQFAALGTALSGELHADVLGSACYDSDFLWINLLNADEGIDGWVGIGSGKELGITRRNKLTPWKKKVRDYARFAQCAREDYVIADGFLQDTADCLGLPRRQSCAGVRYLHEVEPAVCLYFRQREELRQPVLPRLAHYDLGLPFLVGYDNYVAVINQGAAGTGLTIWIRINGAERHEVTYENVYIRRGTEDLPIELTWERMPDGGFAWCWHDPDFPIPPAVTGRMKKEKRWQLENQRNFAIHLTPRGNSRKTLDIQVGFVPDENPQGATWWNVLRKYGSKEAFIKEHNRAWKWVRSMEEDESTCLPYLKREDFD